MVAADLDQRLAREQPVCLDLCAVLLTSDHLSQVGAPDPELKTSPIIDEYEELSLGMELEAPCCYFNDVAYPISTYVRSGDEVLHCQDRGAWVRIGEALPG